MIIQKTVGNIDIDLVLNKQIGIIRGNSGTGKSYLFYLLLSLYMDNAIIINHEDLTNSRVDKIIQNKYKLILLDDADLYLTADMLKEYRHFADNILIAMHNPYNLEGVEFELLYSIFVGHKIIVRESYE